MSNVTSASTLNVNNYEVSTQLSKKCLNSFSSHIDNAVSGQTQPTNGRQINSDSYKPSHKHRLKACNNDNKSHTCKEKYKLLK